MIRTAVLILFLALPLRAAEGPVKKIRADEVSKGPLQLKADETISRDRGRCIEASGNVRVKYYLENGDELQAKSDYSKFDRESSVGEVWGNPDALWIRKDPDQPTTRLLAKKIVLNVKDSELLATGDVSVIQSSSTLSAEKVSYSNLEKKLTATGGTPQFSIRQTQHNTRIEAARIMAYTEKREIHFSENVKGVVYLKEGVKKP